MDNITKKRIKLQEAIKQHPEIEVLNYLGSGNKGEAYLLKDGSVLKITIDRDEYITAMILLNKKLNHIINIYDGWAFECIYDENEYTDNLFAIKEEYIDTTSQRDTIKKFVAAFKHAWFSLYFPSIGYQRATFDDLDEYMINLHLYPDAKNFTKKYILTQGENNQRGNFEDMYNQLVAAYLELSLYVPNAHLDLNDGNIGFTSHGVLKVFDMQ